MEKNPNSKNNILSKKELLPKTQSNYEVYTSLLKSIFENINYYLYKKIHITKKYLINLTIF